MRAIYQREAERAVAHLALVNVTRMAIVRVDDSFGADAAVGLLRGLKEAKLQAVAEEMHDRGKPDFAPIIPKLMKADPQDAIFVGSGTAVVDSTRALPAAGSRAQMVTLSNNASAGFIKALGPLAHGTVVSQVLPSERSVATPIVKETFDLARAKCFRADARHARRLQPRQHRQAGTELRPDQPHRAGLRRPGDHRHRRQVPALNATARPARHFARAFSRISTISV